MVGSNKCDSGVRDASAAAADVLRRPALTRAPGPSARWAARSDRARHKEIPAEIAAPDPRVSAAFSAAVR